LARRDLILTHISIRSRTFSHKRLFGCAVRKRATPVGENETTRQPALQPAARHPLRYPSPSASAFCLHPAARRTKLRHAPPRLEHHHVARLRPSLEMRTCRKLSPWPESDNFTVTSARALRPLSATGGGRIEFPSRTSPSIWGSPSPPSAPGSRGSVFPRVTTSRSSWNIPACPPASSSASWPTSVSPPSAFWR
jgi:hypothetical protein